MNDQNVNNRDQGPEESSEDFQEGKSPKSKTGIIALLAAIALGLGKLKFLLVFLKLGKFMGTIISMLVMIYMYAITYGWSFAIGFVFLILVHEMGHYITAKRLNLNVSAPIFIPFIGAFIAMKDQPRNAVIEAEVGLGGPVLGSLAALFCLIIGLC
ncbi:MAG: site-2 protease family protein, partial [Chitinophagales bacterium]